MHMFGTKVVDMPGTKVLRKEGHGNQKPVC
jgi:hypothetical protein